MTKQPRLLKEIFTAIPVFSSVLAAAYVINRHRIDPFSDTELLAWVLVLIAALGVGEIVQRYLLLFSIDRHVSALSETSETLLAGHVARFFLKDRSAFPPFDVRVKKSKQIWFLGMSLQGLVAYHQGVFVKKARDGASLRVLIMNPESPSCDAKAVGLFSATDPATLRNHIAGTINFCQKLKEDFNASIELRLTNFVPTFSLVLIDPDDSDGVIIVEMYPYLVTAHDRVHFELTPGDGEWYQYFRDQFEGIWRDAPARRS